jgi:hypothetical protein
MNTKTMNIFNAHPQEQGISYTAHLLFALGIAIRLLRCVIAFATHAIFPFVGIRRALDLEATCRFLQNQNIWIENKKLEKRSISKGNEYWDLASMTGQVER